MDMIHEVTHSNPVPKITIQSKVIISPTIAFSIPEVRLVSLHRFSS